MILVKFLIYLNHIDSLLNTRILLKYQITDLIIFQLIELKIVLE